jgi:hypothetical protein
MYINFLITNTKDITISTKLKKIKIAHKNEISTNRLKREAHAEAFSEILPGYANLKLTH